jgi:hypothetical protein
MFQRFNLGVREAGNTLPVISAASVTPTTVTETTALLSVTATDDGGETNLTYTWSSLNPRLFWLPSSFTPNGTNAAKTCTVQFSTPGTFTFRVTVKDAANGQAFRDVSVTVQDVLTTLTAAPVSVEVVQGSGKALGFNALNQFNKAMNPPSEVTWTKVSGIGTVSADGFYQSPADQTGQAVVRVSSGTKTADVNISVIAQPKAPVITSVPPSTVVQGSDVRYSVTVTGVPAPNYTVTGLPLGGNGSLKWYEEGQYFVIYGSTCPVGTVLGPVTLRVSNGINPDAIQIFSVTITGAGGVPGDLNHDGHVTFDDLAGWLSAFGKAKGESGYNAEADLVTTGSSANVVDFDDFTIFLARYEN